jgi:protein N-terminal amidase
VVVGYPEKVGSASRWTANSRAYNSVLAVNGDGETVLNYRKKHLYHTDVTWATEEKGRFFSGLVEPVDNVVLGISMDIKLVVGPFPDPYGN